MARDGGAAATPINVCPNPSAPPGEPVVRPIPLLALWRGPAVGRRRGGGIEIGQDRLHIPHSPHAVRADSDKRVHKTEDDEHEGHSGAGADAHEAAERPCKTPAPRPAAA